MCPKHLTAAALQRHSTTWLLRGVSFFGGIFGATTASPLQQVRYLHNYQIPRLCGFLIHYPTVHSWLCASVVNAFLNFSLALLKYTREELEGILSISAISSWL